ncbi:MAG: hypothetical protein IIA61_06655 [Candidatus Marinimicrobia bacterium]|nr:hypothetical protein [Candidatus Neomarinimicrobiota bacterium]
MIILDKGMKLAGEYSAIWDGQDDQGVQVASGIYLYTLNAGNRVLVKKLVLLK